MIVGNIFAFFKISNVFGLYSVVSHPFSRLYKFQMLMIFFPLFITSGFTVGLTKNSHDVLEKLSLNELITVSV